MYGQSRGFRSQNYLQHLLFFRMMFLPFEERDVLLDLGLFRDLTLFNASVQDLSLCNSMPQLARIRKRFCHIPKKNHKLPVFTDGLISLKFERVIFK